MEWCTVAMCGCYYYYHTAIVLKSITIPQQKPIKLLCITRTFTHTFRVRTILKAVTASQKGELASHTIRLRGHYALTSGHQCARIA